METINRALVSITFRPKFLEWVNNLPDRGDLIYTLQMLNDDRPVYLIPNYDDSAEKLKWLKKYRMEILEEAFESICTEPNWWPKIKSPKEFDDYLCAEFHSMVWDMAEDEPLERNDFE
jgi:hypothetical protein